MVRLTLSLSVAIAALLASLAVPAFAADDFQSWKEAIRRDCPTAGDALANLNACAQRYLDRAIADGRLTRAEVDACVAQVRPERRARGGPALTAWSGPCGLERRVRATFPREPTSPPKPVEAVIRGELREARIESMTLPVAAPGTLLSTRNLRRPDIVSAVFEGRFALVPNRGLDNLRYFAQTIGEFGQRCPGSDRSAAMLDALPYLTDNLGDTIARLRTGDVSETEFAQLLAGAVQVFEEAGPCTFDHANPYAYEQCIAERDEAPGVLPSLDALNDVDVLLTRHGCQAPETQRYLDNLAAYVRQIRLSATATTGLPPADTPAGQRYRQVFDQCARQAGGGAADKWCGCFVQDLHARARTDASALETLMAEPFVDVSYDLRPDGTMVPPGGLTTPGRSVEYRLMSPRGRCGSDVAPIRWWREATLPRVTACLVPARSSGDRCTYRTAWGSFSARAVGPCPVRIDSRVWGAQEVQCATTAGGQAPEALGTVDTDGTRRHRDCSTTPCVTRFAVERDVPAGFLPKRPAITPADVPLVLTVTRQTARASLSGIVVGPSVATVANAFDDPLRSRALASRLRRDIARVLTEDGGVVLQCLYEGEASRWYWFGTTPRQVLDQAFETPIPDHPLLAIAAARDWCPAAPEALPARPATTRDVASPTSPTAPARTEPKATRDTEGTRDRDARVADRQRRVCEKYAERLAKLRAMVARGDRASQQALLSRMEAKHEATCGR